MEHNLLAASPSEVVPFDRNYIEECEADQCLSHSVAFERITGWPVHAAMVGETVLRFHVEDDGQGVFDVRGMMTPLQYQADVIRPLIRTRSNLTSEVGDYQLKIGFRCIGAEGAAALGFTVDEQRITNCKTKIEAKKGFLDAIPVRPEPRFPPALLSRYAWNGCVPFAEALSRVLGLPAAIMQPTKLMPDVKLSGSGIHAVVVHPDGDVEDVWGRQKAENVALRYGFASWIFDQEAHTAKVSAAIQAFPAREKEVADIEALIREYRAALQKAM